MPGKEVKNENIFRSTLACHFCGLDIETQEYMLKGGGNPQNAGDWIFISSSLTEAGKKPCVLSRTGKHSLYRKS